MPGTGKQVRVPVCITYDLNAEGRINRARIYVLVNAFLEQIGARQAPRMPSIA